MYVLTKSILGPCFPVIHLLCSFHDSLGTFAHLSSSSLPIHKVGKKTQKNVKNVHELDHWPVQTDVKDLGKDSP